jgi:hypothetical protein
MQIFEYLFALGSVQKNKPRDAQDIQQSRLLLFKCTSKRFLSLDWRTRLTNIIAQVKTRILTLNLFEVCLFDMATDQLMWVHVTSILLPSCTFNLVVHTTLVKVHT